ncbi:hypothetical protein ABZ546_00770 [Brachybacterium paraconglomeratum]
MVAGFEQRYDRMITSGAGSVVPSAEDIAAEVEEYLASFEAEDGQAPEGSGGQSTQDTAGPTDGEGSTGSEGPTGTDGSTDPEDHSGPETPQA